MLFAIAIAPLLLQATVFVSPDPPSFQRIPSFPSREDEKASFLRMHTDADRQSLDPAKPREIAAKDYWSFSEALQWNRLASESAARGNMRSVVPPLRIVPSAPCRQIADFAAGTTREGSTALHGRRSTFECGSFLLQIVREDLTKPLTNTVATVGFPEYERSGTLNRGAFSRYFIHSSDGKRSVHYHWVGRGWNVEISLISDGDAYSSLTRYGDKTIDDVTRTLG